MIYEAMAFFILLALAVAAPWAGARQLVVVTTPSWSSTTGTLRRYARADPTAAWKPVGAAVPVVVGKKGLGWGDGPLPHEPAGPEKKEGDGRAPAGAFRLTAALGVADAPPAGTRLAYRRSTESTRCVDDPGSDRYNQIVEAPGDWKSAEVMRRTDGLYDWVVVVGHNAARVPGAGSCVFLHVWRTPTSPTVGCTAMAKPAIEELMAWLEPEAVLVEMPEAALAAWRRRYRGLP
jgi:L,D-peptidoglycan transpeptidase YkuD (ErfK/YbiS/YcfS/YnhG family)